MRRAALYLFFDPRGQVDDYVLHTLEALRPHVEHIRVVSNSPLDEVNEARLREAADHVTVRENVGFDVWAYKTALAQLGEEALAAHDEIVMLNHTFFGPVGSFDALFADMEARPELDFWGITEHGATHEHPFDRSVSMPPHLQSHWIAVRRRMFTSDAWRTYWDEMPMIESYAESVLRHESVFTPHFEALGFRSAAAYPADHYDSPHPAMENVEQLLRDGCPIVKRRAFFYDPLFAEEHGTDGRRITQLMGERGYPLEALYANLARTSTPRWLATNLGLVEVLPDVDSGYDREHQLRVVAVAHVFRPEMTDELLDRLDVLPHGYDLVVTTADEEKRRAIAAALERRGPREGRTEIRVVGRDRGGDVSAFFVDCADVIDSDDHDVVVKVHSGRPSQDPAPVSELFRRHLFENLLNSPGYAANVLRLFQQHASLGMVFPPTYHIGHPTLGHAWFATKAVAEREAERLGVTVPLDDSTPLSAYGSFFVARPQALRAITAAGYTHEDFADESGLADGALSQVLERLASYVVLSSGHHVREVMTADLAALNYSMLEYRTIQVSSKLASRPRDQLKRIRRLKDAQKAYRKLTGGRGDEVHARTGTDDDHGPIARARRRWSRR